jgi:branched-chain amino acid aminotransferase
MGGPERKDIHEVGTMNIFFVIDGKVITPATDGAILHGITRDSFLQILEEKGISHEERVITIDEVVEAYKAGKLEEAFGAGTAAVVSHVAEIAYGDFRMKLPPVEDRKIGLMLKDYLDGLRSGRIEDKHGWIVPVRQEATV